MGIKPMPKNTTDVYVRPHQGKWAVWIGKANAPLSTHRKKTVAERAARKAARKRRPAILTLCRSDGTFQDYITYR